MISGKRGQVVSILVIVIILILILFWVASVTINSRECNRNSDCSSDEYCGADFSCHDFKVITVEKQDYVKPALIIAAAIIFAVIIGKFARKDYEYAEDDESGGNSSSQNKQKTEVVKKVVHVTPSGRELTQAELEELRAKENEVFTNVPMHSKKDQKSSVKNSASYVYPDFEDARKTLLEKERNKLKESNIRKNYISKISHSKNNHNLFQNSKYIALILAGLCAVGLVLSIPISAIGFSLSGAVVLFFIVFEMWGRAADLGYENVLLWLVSILLALYGLIAVLRGNGFLYVGLGFFAVVIVLIRETISWVQYKALKK